MKKDKINYQTLLTLIWIQYNAKYKFIICDCEIPHCFLKEKEIYFPQNCFKNPCSRDVFDLLHEIGHLETNKKGMKRCEEEYYATKWAIKEMKKYNFNISLADKRIFQDYIWKWRETGIKLKGKNMPTKKELTLSW